MRPRIVLKSACGSVTPFILGCFVLVVLVLGTTTDIAVLQIDRQVLQAQADCAALAASQAADLSEVYSKPIGAFVPIDATLARQRAMSLLAGHPARLTGLRIDALVGDGRTVSIRVSALIKPPFLRLLGTSIRINAQARATTAVN